ncbi:MAG: hypothetical protein U0271_33390 [Polyangiaceae bacterium]
MSFRMLVIAVSIVPMIGCIDQVACEPATAAAPQSEVGVLRREDFLRTGGINAAAKLESANQQMRQGEYAQALETLIWCLVRGPQEDPPFVGLWTSELPRLFGQLAQRYAPAREELVHQRDKLEKRIRELTAREYLVYLMYAQLNRALGDGERTMNTFVALARPREEPTNSPLREFFPVVLESLFNAGRLDLVAHWGVLVLDRLSQERDVPTGASDADRAADAALDEMGNRATSLVYSAMLHESGVLVARQFAARAIGTSASAELTNALIDAATEHCQAIEVGKLRDLARILLSEAQFSRVQGEVSACSRGERAAAPQEVGFTE